jgi:hypothetical protein
LFSVIPSSKMLGCQTAFASLNTKPCRRAGALRFASRTIGPANIFTLTISQAAGFDQRRWIAKPL